MRSGFEVSGSPSFISSGSLSMIRNYNLIALFSLYDYVQSIERVWDKDIHFCCKKVDKTNHKFSQSKVRFPSNGAITACFFSCCLASHEGWVCFSVGVFAGRCVVFLLFFRWGGNLFLRYFRYWITLFLPFLINFDR
jgi:hypothetical protein